MLKRICALIVSASLLTALTACSMPSSIFTDTVESSTENEDDAAVDLYDFSFTLDSQNYYLPANFNYFSSRGWELELVNYDEYAAEAEVEETDEAEADETQEADEAQVDGETGEILLAAGEYSDYYVATNGTYVIGLKFYNNTDSDAAVKSCRVVGMLVDSSAYSVPFVSIEDCVEFGTTRHELTELCGDPSFTATVDSVTGDVISINDMAFDSSSSDDEDEDNEIEEVEDETANEDEDAQESEEIEKLYYYVNEHTFFEFTLGEYDGTPNRVVGMVIESDTDPEISSASDEDEDDSENVDEDLAELLALYEEPALLGTTLEDLSFKYESTLYTLPMPVSELLDDGWEFLRGESIIVGKGCTADGVILKKGNLCIELTIHNYDTVYSRPAENCFAVTLSAGVTGPFADILMPKGVTLGTDAETLLSSYSADSTIEVDVVSLENGEEAAASDETADAEEDAEETDDEDESTTLLIYEYEDYIKYSYVLPDDEYSITLPTSITSVSDSNSELLGEYRKHVDFYVSKANNSVVYIYIQNCPEYLVDEEAILNELLENQD